MQVFSSEILNTRQAPYLTILTELKFRIIKQEQLLRLSQPQLRNENKHIRQVSIIPRVPKDTVSPR